MPPFSNLIIQPPIIAHRGVSRYAPENTLAAFRKAFALGIHWIELDVMLTMDNEAVIIHDELLDRTTNGKGSVEKFSYQALQDYDAGTWFDPQFSAERIPTLKQVLQLLDETGMSANIEIKPQMGREELTVKIVLDLIQKEWKPDRSQLLISSFSLLALETVRQYSSDIALGLLMHEWNPEWQVICDKLHCVTVNVNQDILTRENSAEIKATERLLLAYTVNDSKRAQELFSWGVDAVFSDDPAAILIK